MTNKIVGDESANGLIIKESRRMCRIWISTLHKPPSSGSHVSHTGPRSETVRDTHSAVKLGVLRERVVAEVERVELLSQKRRLWRLSSDDRLLFEHKITVCVCKRKLP